MNEIDEIKIKLYSKLLQKTTKELTKNEIDLIYVLSKERSIQQLLEKGKNNN